MRRRARDPITRLQTAIDCLPEPHAAGDARRRARPTRSSSGPTRTAAAGSARCWPRTATAGARASSPSPARGTRSRAPTRSARPRRASCRCSTTCSSPRSRRTSTAPRTWRAAIAEHKASLARSRPTEIIARRLRRVSPAAADDRPAVHQPQQVQRRERLREEQVGAGARGRSRSASLSRVAGQHHDRRVGGRRAPTAAAGRSRSRSGAACRCRGRRSPGAPRGRARPPPHRRAPPTCR